MDKHEDGCYGSLKGIALIGKVLAGRCKMHYTRVAVGKGSLPEGMTPKTLEEPPEYVMDAMISSVTNPVDGECQVAVQLSSANVEKGFYAKWLILYAEDPDDGEVPYTVLRLEDEPEWIRPSSSIVGKLAHFDIIAAVGDVDCVTATIDPDALLTLESAQQLLNDHNADPNAHAGLFENAVTLDETGKIPESILPEKVVFLDETGKIPSYYLPDDVFKQSGVLTAVITIPASAWQKDEDGPCAYRAEVAFEDATEEHIPYVSFDSASMETAENCGLCDKAETADGILCFWAESVPEADMIARAALFGSGGGTSAIASPPPATTWSLGCIKVGSGLKIEKDGTLSVDTASEADVNKLLAGVFDPDNK